MSHPSHCPKCNVSWYEDITIYEHFLDVYKRRGVPPSYRADGITDAEAAARRSAEMYGCTPDNPKHFGINVVGIEDRDKYDGVSYWKCECCNVVVDRFTNVVVN